MNKENPGATALEMLNGINPALFREQRQCLADLLMYHAALTEKFLTPDETMNLEGLEELCARIADYLKDYLGKDALMEGKEEKAV